MRHLTLAFLPFLLAALVAPHFVTPSQAARKIDTPEEIACVEEYDICTSACDLATPNPDDGDAWIDCVASCAHERRQCMPPERTIRQSVRNPLLPDSLSSGDGGGPAGGSDSGGGGEGFDPSDSASTGNAGNSTGGGGGIIY